jgi:mRNA interferase RelE/StbE
VELRKAFTTARGVAGTLVHRSDHQHLHFAIDGIIAYSYILDMKAVRYSAEAIANLKLYGNMAARVRKAINEYADNPAAHANNVTRLVGSPASRMRVAGYRVIFVETEQDLVVTRIGPRGSVYD